MATQPQTNAEIVESTTTTFERVAADAIANTISGVGLGLLTGVGLWAVGASWATVATWATASAIAWAGAINWIRFSQDEIANRLTFWRMARDIDELNAEVAALEQENAAQRTDLHNVQNQLRSEQYLAAQARKPANPKHGGPIIDMYPQSTRDDAKVLISRWYATGNWPGERTMGWTRDRHVDARQLLERVEILVMGGKNGATPPDKPPNNEAWALATLAAAYGIAPE